VLVSARHAQLPLAVVFGDALRGAAAGSVELSTLSNGLSKILAHSSVFCILLFHDNKKHYYRKSLGVEEDTKCDVEKELSTYKRSQSKFFDVPARPGFVPVFFQKLGTKEIVL